MSENIKKSLEIVEVPVGQLKPALYNPNKMGAYQDAQLDKSIKVHGFAQPLIANRNPKRKFVLVSGHQRLRSAKRLGYKTVPVILLDLDEEQEKLLNLRLNRVHGEFDLDLLKAFDIDLLLDVGFDDTDLGDIWNASLEIEDDNFDEQKAVKEAATTDIKFGDMFSLGKHRLMALAQINS